MPLRLWADLVRSRYFAVGEPPLGPLHHVPGDIDPADLGYHRE